MYLEARKKFPGNTIQAKFDLLNSLAIGKSESIENFKSALSSVVKEFPKTDVADRAQGILEAIQKHSMSTLPDSIRYEIEPDFVVEQNGGQYYVFAMKNDKADFTDFVSKITQFNEEYHQFENLKSNTIISNEGYQLLLVREFTEMTRIACQKGAKILFVPFSTDEKHGHLRVKICSQSRAVENQIFVATAGTIGNIPSVENMDINYAQSGIYTPSDFAFPPDAIAGECNTNIETVVIADLDLAALERARNTGTVLNWKDRRMDMYEVLEK